MSSTRLAADLIALYGREAFRRIQQGKVWVGATRAMIVASLGRPSAVERYQDKGLGEKEVYVYDDGENGRQPLRVVFSQGRCERWHDAARSQTQEAQRAHHWLTSYVPELNRAPRDSAEPASPVIGQADARDALVDLPEARALFEMLARLSLPLPQGEKVHTDAGRGTILAEAVLHWPEARLALVQDLSDLDARTWQALGFAAIDADSAFASPELVGRALRTSRYPG